MPRRAARSLTLCTGSQVPLPLLVPSFSSKGFPTLEDDESGATRSEANAPFEVTNAVLEESLLISAFDIFHDYIPAPKGMLSNAEVVFIDSGGYEKLPFFDSTEPLYHPFPNPPFELEDYRSVLGSFDDALPLVTASPDWHTEKLSIAEQIAFAQEFLADYPFTKSFIIKPGTRAYVRVPDVVPSIEDLNAFDIVGVTEKDLGQNLKSRLKTLAELRAALDRVGLDMIPIHVWGGLDPVITPLYFFAGGEIFDGLSWLRYAFHKGMLVYRDEWQVLDGGVTRSLKHSRMQVWFNNLSELTRLTSSLRMFEASGRTNFAAFDWHREELERAFHELAAEIPEMKGVD